MLDSQIERRRAQSRDWYRRNRERELTRARVRSATYRREHPELARQSNITCTRKKRLTLAGRADSMWRAADARAKKKGIPFSLTKNWVLDRISRPCELTGIAYVLESGRGCGHRNPYAPSIDRKNSTLGYTEDNCRMIVWGLNAALATWGESDYLTIAKAYASRR